MWSILSTWVFVRSSLLVVVGVSDIGDFVITYHKVPIGRGEIAGHPTLARVAHFVVVPEDLTWVEISTLTVRCCFTLFHTIRLEHSSQITSAHTLTVYTCVTKIHKKVPKID